MRHTMSDERIVHLAERIGVGTASVRHMLLTDWDGQGAGRQAWLDGATMNELADWIVASLQAHHRYCLAQE